MQDEFDKGWIYRFEGSVEEAQAACPLGLAQLGLAITDSRSTIGSGQHSLRHQWRLYSQ